MRETRSKRKRAASVPAESYVQNRCCCGSNSIRITIIPVSDSPIVLSAPKDKAVTITSIKKAIEREYGFAAIRQQLLEGSTEAEPLHGTVLLDELLGRKSKQQELLNLECNVDGSQLSNSICNTRTDTEGNQSLSMSELELFLLLRDPPFRWLACGEAMTTSGDNNEVVSGNSHLIHTGS
jgi:hypothetical protein